MTPLTSPRKPKNSSRTNLLIALAFHTAIVLVLVFFAAREGLLGKQLKKIAVEMVREKEPEKPAEPEKPKPEPPRTVEPPKTVEPQRTVETHTPAVPQSTAPTPPTSTTTVVAPPVFAPPASDVPSFEFEGGRSVQTSSDPAELYRGFVEYSLRARWNRPDNIADDNYVAEVEISVDRTGKLSLPEWKRSSGDTRWDNSVRAAIAASSSLDRPPPTNFPPRVIVRFDVQDATEPVIP
jgi:outer membrane biosynthesis protein TonB